MSKYRLEVLEDSNNFSFNNTTYAAGDTFETDSDCEAIAFYNAFKTNNPNGARVDETPDFWKNVSAACTATQGAGPGTGNSTTPPVESDPNKSGGDSAKKQGAPGSSPGGTVTGTGKEGGSAPSTPPGEEPTRPPNGEPDPTHGDEKSKDKTNGGDPIDIFTGAFYLQESDLEIPNTILPLSFVREYRSGDAVYGPFGWNWDHNYNLYVRELNDGNVALWRNLHEDIFRFDGVSFEPPRGVFEKLDRVPGIAQAFETAGEGGTIMHFERPAGWIDGERVPLSW